MSVKIETLGGNAITVSTPYHPDFPRRARSLGGKWNSALWVFDARDESRVRQLCREIYGEDGETPQGDLVTLRATFSDRSRLSVRGAGIYIAGRCIARAYSRDSGARLGEGVVMIEGTAGSRGSDAVRSGGSRANWETIIDGPCVIEIRDVPRAAAEKAIADPPTNSVLTPGPTLEIVEG